MGGYGSTRWGWRTTRATTDEVIALDVRALARRRYFTAGPGEAAAGIEAWRCNGDEIARVGVHYRGDDPSAVSLEYQMCWLGEEWHIIRERIELVHTSCPFGGTRRWFVCPGCGVRRALLFCVGGLFCCRVCHGLAYRSTRQTLGERARRREEKRQQRTSAAPW
jgi:hypothetical protein